MTKYETIWRNKWLTSKATSLAEMAAILREAANSLEEMDKAGILLDAGSMGDDYAFLYTHDPILAAKYDLQEFDMEDEDEYASLENGKS